MSYELDLDSCCLAPQIKDHVCLNCKRKTKDAALFTIGFYSILHTSRRDDIAPGRNVVGMRDRVYVGKRK